MRGRQALERLLTDIDGRGYGSYKRLRGTYDLGLCRLVIDHVQADPYAPPSKVRTVLDRATAALPDDLVDTPLKRVAVSDFLTRRCHEAASRVEGAGRRGPITIGAPGQQVLPRTSVLIADDRVEARWEVALPAGGRRVLGHVAARLLTDTMPRLVESSLCHPHLDALALRRHVELLLDQEELRSRLAQRSLVAFVGDGAVLPRRSGDSDLPMVEGATPFSSPETFRVNFELSSGRTVTGMGIPEGVTVIVGGGYHGKSTLLRALERGVYPHIAGDGREWVITRPDAVTIRAEDGRAVTGVDISPFIDDLPSGTDTTRFTTGNASGSTSQAANLVEAIEAGTSLLLIDEDTSATNFMIRDEPMRRLIPAEREPITPFVDRIRPLYTELGVSTILVAGGSGSFFGVADRVIALDAYVPRDVTEAAHAIADSFGLRRVDGDPTQRTRLFPEVPNRVPTGSALRTRGRTTPAKARGRNVIRYGAHTIELNAVAQLVDPAQTTAIARFLDRLAELFDGRQGIRDAVEQLYRRIDEDGLDVLSPYSGHPGHLALPRPHEVHAALNRYRGLALTSRK
ncbi:ABC-ATPase domain-containing protein [Saccharomonospora viridis]|uniref:Predicted ATPase of the ABC class n=1 Tax=Saccharomonospora viridis (strain ATCC 15386 / DSM 43017 / JCM 3036 / CCUG 5913 / NBRC 12207 / NCIMB 9602 / P101) TaxID=471857 RepID=C7MYE7_SACVD|nr:ABC-ATPase domain-containing protein [Saccharomonospora viridis]ACU97366.1 predicted ATPase of the ABC class [Saccharomonospora viridis DSM 43017]